MDVRESRLRTEFERMLALRAPYSLFTVQCADLGATEATEWLKSETRWDVIQDGLNGFLDPDEFRHRYPDSAPEKYLIHYTCRGLVRQRDGNIVASTDHWMEVVYGWDYPARPPIKVWLTDIWHPNFRRPYICTEGREFAVGLTLDQIVLAVGEMIQYRNYNVRDPLSGEAAEWASRNVSRLPVDDRDLLDSRRRLSPTTRQGGPGGEPLVQLLDAPTAEADSAEPVVELLGSHSDG